MICCACRAETTKIEAYDDHDDLCTLPKYRCNQLECAWCDLVDCGIGENDPDARVLIAATDRTSWKGWNAPMRPRPPAIEALDLSTTESGSSTKQADQESTT